jgi:tagatose 1,6-diphosphate aldolase
MPFRLRDCLPLAGFGVQGFKFLDTGPLIDNELELVAPSVNWVDPLLAACRHPMSQEQSPALADTSRQQVLDFIKAAPGGRQEGKASTKLSPTYHFWMHITDHPELEIAGGINLRIGHQFDLVTYHGQIGYHVYPALRGHHYAERACRLLFPLAIRHGINPLWITCNPDNFASRRTCERLGGTLVEIVPVPQENPLFAMGEIEKCRYRIDLT